MERASRALVERGRFIDAAEALERELAAARRGHPFRDVEYDADAAPLLEELAWLRWRLARFAEAADALAAARRLREARGDDEAALATVLERQAAVAHSLGDPAAFGLYDRALGARTEDSVERAVLRRNFGAYLRDLGQWSRAERELVAAEKRLGSSGDGAHAELAATLKARAFLHELMGAPEAFDLAQDALAATLRVHGDDHPFVGGALLLVGRALGRGRDHPAAREALRRAEALFVDFYGAQHPLVASTLRARSRIATDAGELEEAAELAVAAVRVYAATYAGHHYLVPLLVAAATALMQLERWEAALEPLRQAMAIDPRDRGLAERAARCYLRLGRAAEAWRLITRRG